MLRRLPEPSPGSTKVKVNAFSARLRTRIVLTAVIAVVPAIVAVLFSQVTERREERARTIADNLRLARLAAAQMASVLESTQLLLATLGDFPPLLSDDPRACSDVLARVLRDHPQYLNVGVADADGSLFCAAAPIDQSVPMPGGDSWFERTLRTRATTVGGYQTSATTGKPALTIGYPLRRVDGSVARIVAASIGLEQFEQIAVHADLPPGTTVTLFDRDRRILARVPDGPLWIGKTVSGDAPVQELSGGASDDLREDAGVDGIRRLYVTVPVSAPFDTGCTSAWASRTRSRLPRSTASSTVTCGCSASCRSPSWPARWRRASSSSSGR